MIKYQLEREGNTMKESKIITDDLKEIAQQYPIYSQDGKEGNAVAWLKLELTGIGVTYYITEAERNGEYEGRENWDLFGVSNNGGKFRYDYFCLGELEELETLTTVGGVKITRVEGWKPSKLADITEVAKDLKTLWELMDNETINTTEHL